MSRLTQTKSDDSYAEHDDINCIQHLPLDTNNINSTKEKTIIKFLNDFYGSSSSCKTLAKYHREIGFDQSQSIVDMAVFMIMNRNMNKENTTDIYNKIANFLLNIELIKELDWQSVFTSLEEMLKRSGAVTLSKKIEIGDYLKNYQDYIHYILNIIMQNNNNNNELLSFLHQIDLILINNKHDIRSSSDFKISKSENLNSKKSIINNSLIEYIQKNKDKIDDCNYLKIIINNCYTDTSDVISFELCSLNIHLKKYHFNDIEPPFQILSTRKNIVNIQPDATALSFHMHKEFIRLYLFHNKQYRRLFQNDLQNLLHYNVEVSRHIVEGNTLILKDPLFKGLQDKFNEWKNQ